jgi:integrase
MRDRFPELERWIHSKELRSCVPATIARYRKTVAAVLRALESKKRPTDPARWTLDDALWIKQQPHAHHWALNVLADFARRSGNDVIRDAGIPASPPSGRVRWLSKPEVEVIIRSTADDPVLAFVTMLGIGEGLRRVEWGRLRVEDIDLAGNRLLVRGKGRARPKQAWLALHPAFPKVYRQLEAFRNGQITEARRRHPGCAIPLEVLVHRSASGLSPYSPSGLDLLVHRIELRVRRTGGGVRLSSHMFRRSGATLLEEALLSAPKTTVDGVYRVLQGFLRHDNLATTMRYLEANPKRQRRALERYAQALPWNVGVQVEIPAGGRWNGRADRGELTSRGRDRPRPRGPT